jgi:hypothetical protein
MLMARYCLPRGIVAHCGSVIECAHVSCGGWLFQILYVLTAFYPCVSSIYFEQTLFIDFLSFVVIQHPKFRGAPRGTRDKPFENNLFNVSCILGVLFFWKCAAIVQLSKSRFQQRNIYTRSTTYFSRTRITVTTFILVLSIHRTFQLIHKCLPERFQLPPRSRWELRSSGLLRSE